MDHTEFKNRGQEVLDFVGNYHETLRNRQLYPDVKPGYLLEAIPKEAPHNPEKWEELRHDIDHVILPGMVPIQDPHFHGYYPLANSYPAILGNLLADGMGSITPFWSINPAGTELEVAMMDWLAKMLKLPKEFVFSSGGEGGGVLQNAATEANLMAVLFARSMFVKKIKKEIPDLDNISIIGKLVLYCSDQAHTSIEMACRISVITMRTLETDENGALRGDSLEKAVAFDKAKGLIPFFVVITLGTTGVCAFDNLSELGPVSSREGLWLHIDAAYAGSAFICPEYRPILDGVEHATSFVFNPHKMMLVNPGCSAMWVKKRSLAEEAFKIDATYYENQENSMPEFKNWKLGLCRPFISMKLWFVLRMYGQTGLQENVRRHVRLAQEFEKYVQNDDRFEIVRAQLGLVCFRIKGSNDATQNLDQLIRADGRIRISAARFKGRSVLRFSIVSAQTNSDDIRFAWKVIQELAAKV